MMFQSSCLLALSASTALALAVPRSATANTTPQLYTLELAPGVTEAVTDAENGISAM